MYILSEDSIYKNNLDEGSIFHYLFKEFYDYEKIEKSHVLNLSVF